MQGAPKGNTNAIKHGRRSRQLRFSLAIYELPPEFKGVQKKAMQLRETLESLVATVHGSVDVDHAFAISAAVGWEIHHGVAMYLLRKYGEKMSVTDKLACSRDAARAKAERNKFVGELRLGQDAIEDAIDSVYARPLPLPAGDSPADDPSDPPA